MTIDQAAKIAEKYLTDKVQILELTVDIIRANTQGYKEAHEDMNNFLCGIKK